MESHRCNNGVTWAKSPCQWYGDDTVCVPCSNCKSNEFVKQGCTVNSNTVCQQHAASCEVGDYEETTPTAFRDRECAPISICKQGEFEKSPPTATSDRICQSISTCNSMCTSGISFQGICMCQAHCHSCIQTDTTSFCTVCKDGFLLEGGACVSACQKGSAEIQTGTSFVGFGRICVAGSSAPLLETPSLQFEMAAPTSFTDRMCVDVTMCSVDEYQTVPASYKSDRECTLLQVCGLDQYIDSAAGLDIGYYYGKLADGRTGRQTLYDTDRSCAQLTVCSSLEYESRTPSATSDRLCTTLAECMVGLQFEEQAPSKTSDRICQLITSCPPGEQQSLAATPFRNTVCRACAEGKFKSEPGQATCSDSTVCSASQYESDSLTPVADRQCTSLAGN